LPGQKHPFAKRRDIRDVLQVLPGSERLRLFNGDEDTFINGETDLALFPIPFLYDNMCAWLCQSFTVSWWHV